MHVEEAAALVARDGCAVLRSLVSPRLLARIDRVVRAHADSVMAALGERPIGIGSREGYHELVQRSPGRFDVPMAEHDLAPIWGSAGSLAPEVPWLGAVRAVLGPDAEPSFSGVVFSRPGSPAQQWHIDSLHEAAEHQPAHAVNVLLALRDVPLEAGPTEVALRSHPLTNHLAAPALSRDDLLYQTASELTPASLAGERVVAEASALRAGDCLLFDDRILHRGLANRSEAERWIAYFSYARPRDMSAVDETHFEATRSLFATDVAGRGESGGARTSY